MSNEPTPANELAQRLTTFLNEREESWPSSWLSFAKGKRDEWFFVETVDPDGTPRTFEVTVEEVS